MGDLSSAASVPAGPLSKSHPTPSAPNGKASKIHVIDVRRTLIDILSVSPEEASLAVEAAIIDLPHLRGALQALPTIAERARGLIRFLNSPIPEGQMAEITARSLFSCPAYLPLIDRGAHGQSDGTLLRIRPASFVRAIHIDGSIVAIAAEEAVDLLGVVVDPVRFAELLVDTYGGGVNRGIASYVETGTFSPPVLGSVGTRLFPQPESSPGIVEDGARILFEEKGRPRAYPITTTRDLERRGFAVYHTPDRETAAAVVATLLRKAHASAAYYQGAAVAFALDALALARQGKGPSRLLAIVGHSPGGLREEIVTRKGARTVPPPAEPPLTQEKLKYLLQRLSKTRHIAADDPNTYVYELSPLFDLFRVGAFDIYVYVLIEGRESPMLDTFLERETMAYAKETQLRRLAHASVLSTALVRQYLLIVEDKLGAARLAKLMEALRLMSGRGVRTIGEPWALTKSATALVQIEDPRVVLNLLTQKERALVQTEYENRKTEWNAQVNNKCPHVRLAKRLRSAPTMADAEEILTELSKYFVERRRGKADPTDALRDKASAARDFAGRDERESEASPQSQWLMCRNCGFRAICPHVRDRIRLEARGIPYDELRTRLFRYAVRYNARAENGQPESYTYFCRICSERLAEFIEEDRTAELMGRFGDLDSSLRSVVWVEALNAAKFVRFPAPTDPKQFASAVTGDVYPLVMMAEEATAKKSRKRALAAAASEAEEGETVEPRTRLYAVLYIYAYILNLIQSSESSNKKGAEVGFEGVRPGAKISTYADRILTVITDTHKGLLSQIEDITTEFIAARFKEAFRIVRGDSGDMRLRPVDAEEELANQTVVIDPIYHYAVGGAKMFGDLPPGRSTTPEKAKREFETVMGDPLPTIVKASREYAKLPALAPLYSKKLVVEVPADTSLEFLYKDPRVNLYAKLYRPKLTPEDTESIKLFYSLAGVVKGIESTGLNTWVGGLQKPKHARRDEHPASQRKPVLQRSSPDLVDVERGYAIESYSLFLEYTTTIANKAARDNYLQKLKKARDAENGYLMIKATASLKCYYNFGFETSRQFQRLDVPVTMLYDENGDRHAWNILMFQPAGSSTSPSAPTKPIEIKAKKGDDSIVKAIASGVIGGAALVDYKCDICGVRQTETGSLSVERTIRSLRIATEIVSFYEFYETRCPKGGLHSFTGGKCQKCGMAEDLSADPAKRTLRNPAARAFYEQNERTFLVERRELSEPPSIPMTRPAPLDTQDSDLTKWAADWKYDYGAVVKVAEALDITPATIEAIGDMEKRDYAEIKKGEGARATPGDDG